MIQRILLQVDGGHCRQRRVDAPELLDENGICYSLRAGPRAPASHRAQVGAVAVYAQDELNELEFQDLCEASRVQVLECNLKY